MPSTPTVSPISKSRNEAPVSPFGDFVFGKQKRSSDPPPPSTTSAGDHQTAGGGDLAPEGTLAGMKRRMTAIEKFREKAHQVGQSRTMVSTMAKSRSLVGPGMRQQIAQEESNQRTQQQQQVLDASARGRRSSRVLVETPAGPPGSSTVPGSAGPRKEVREAEIFARLPRVSKLLEIEHKYLRLQTVRPYQATPGASKGDKEKDQRQNEFAEKAKERRSLHGPRSQSVRVADGGAEGSKDRNKSSPERSLSFNKKGNKKKKARLSIENSQLVDSEDSDDSLLNCTLNMDRSAYDSFYMNNSDEESEEEEDVGDFDDLDDTPGLAQRTGARSPVPVTPGNSALTGPIASAAGATSPIARKRRLPMPSGADMATMLPELQSHLTSQASVKIAVLLLPKLLLRSKVRQRQLMSQQAEANAVKLTPQLLRKQCPESQLCLWPDETLAVLCRGAKYRLVDRHEVVVYRGTPAVCGAFVVTSGQCTVFGPSQELPGNQQQYHHHSHGHHGHDAAHPSATPGEAPLAPLAQHNRSMWRSTQSNVHAIVAPTMGKKSIYTAASQIQRLSAPFSVGDFNAITEEAHRLTVRASVKCDVWVIGKQAFETAFQTLQQHVKRQLSLDAFANRNMRLHRAHPLGTAQLQTHRLFASCPESVLEEVERNLVPKCLPRNFPVFDIETKPHEIVFLICGRIAVRRPVNGELTHLQTLNCDTDWDVGSPSATAPLATAKSSLIRRKSMFNRNGSDRALRTLSGGHGGMNGTSFSTIGDVEVLHDAPFEASYVTLTQCDCFVLSKEVFDLAIRMLSNVAETIHAAMRLTKQNDMAQSILQYRDMMLRLPLLSDLVGPFSLRDLVRLFKPRVYKPMTVVCSTSSYCDRVILLTKGSIRIGDAGKWYQKEFAGYTGVIPHRWVAPAITQTECETLEIPLTTYVAYLQDMNIYSKVEEWSLHLMFPKAFPPEDIVRTTQRVKDVKSTVLYPISRARKVEIPQALITGLKQAEERMRASQGLPPLRNMILLKKPSAPGMVGGRSTSITPSSTADAEIDASSSSVVLNKRRAATPTTVSRKSGEQAFHGMSRISSTMWVRRAN